jgi:hypothetical protein
MIHQGRATFRPCVATAIASWTRPFDKFILSTAEGLGTPLRSRRMPRSRQSRVPSLVLSSVEGLPTAHLPEIAHIQSGRRRTFNTLDDLLGFLRRLAGDPEVLGRPAGERGGNSRNLEFGSFWQFAVWFWQPECDSMSVDPQSGDSRDGTS